MWIEFHDSVADNPKTERLAQALGAPLYAAGGILAYLWSWAITRADATGNISDFTDKAIAKACKWDGKPSVLVEALTACGFIDGDRDNDDMRLHDWEKYSAKLQERRAKDRARKQRKNPQEIPMENSSGKIQRNIPAENSAPDSNGLPLPIPLPNTVTPNRIPEGEINDDDGDTRACAYARVEDEPDGELVTISVQHNVVFDAAQRAGFPMTAADMDKAVAFMADYSPEWVLEAVRRASGGTREQRCWRYVGGILRRWKAAGGMDEAQRPQPAQTARSGTLKPVKRVNAQQYTQREYTSEELDSLFDNLADEEIAAGTRREGDPK